MRRWQERFTGTIDGTSKACTHRIECTINTQIQRCLELQPGVGVSKRRAERELFAQSDPEPLEVYCYTVTIECVAPERSG